MTTINAPNWPASRFVRFRYGSDGPRWCPLFRQNPMVFIVNTDKSFVVQLSIDDNVGKLRMPNWDSVDDNTIERFFNQGTHTIIFDKVELTKHKTNKHSRAPFKEVHFRLTVPVLEFSSSSPPYWFCIITPPPLLWRMEEKITCPLAEFHLLNGQSVYPVRMPLLTVMGAHPEDLYLRVDISESRFFTYQNVDDRFMPEKIGDKVTYVRHIPAFTFDYTMTIGDFVCSYPATNVTDDMTVTAMLVDIQGGNHGRITRTIKITNTV